MTPFIALYTENLRPGRRSNKGHELNADHAGAQRFSRVGIGDRSLSISFDGTRRGQASDVTGRKEVMLEEFKKFAMRGNLVAVAD